MNKSRVTILLIGLLFLSLIGCMSYKKINVGSAEPFTNHDIQENFQSYNIYIHDDNGVYALQNPDITDNSISGTPKKVTDSDKLTEIKDTNNVKGKDINKYNLNIYTKKPIIENNGVAQSENEIVILEANSEKKVEIKAGDIEKVEMYANDEKIVGIIALYIILCLIAVGLLIWLMVVLLNQAGNSSANSSANSSGNSNSNSGGSNSGSSNSGSSNSGGSCYVATMVYGSYDAPEVLVLRRFRDDFLQKFYLGRLFIKTYYKYSPHFVKRFQNHENVHKPIRFILNSFVKFLSK